MVLTSRTASVPAHLLLSLKACAYDSLLVSVSALGCCICWQLLDDWPPVPLLPPHSSVARKFSITSFPAVHESNHISFTCTYTHMLTHRLL